MSTTSRSATVLLTTGILLIGANLRLPITMMPPMLDSVRRAAELPTSLAGLLTTIPLLMFALLSPIVAQLGIHRGTGQTLLLTMIILVGGSYLRIINGAWALLLGTALVGVGITGGNVLLPALIKEKFPTKIGPLTAVYSTTMSIVASLATAFAGVMSVHIGSRSTMATLSTVSIVALVFWALCAPFYGHPRKLNNGNNTDRLRPIMSAPLSWAIMLVFGLQSLLYYSLLTWLPSIWIAAGFSQVAASTLTTVFQFAGLPFSLLVPTLAYRHHGEAIVVAISAGGYLLGVLGILFSGTNFTANVVAALIAGCGSGAAFNLAIILFQKKAATAVDTARLSGMSQSLGYLLGAVGPILFGLITSRVAVLLLSAVIAAALGICGIITTTHTSIFPAKSQADKVGNRP